MNQPINKISNQEAKQALDSIVNSKLNIIKSIRPPLLLIFLSSISYAAIIFGYGMTEHENTWALAMWGGGVGFALFSGLYLYTYRTLGIKVRLIPRSSSSIKMNLLLTAIFAILTISSREFRLLGFEYSPHLASILCGLIMFYSLKTYPTGEYIDTKSLEQSNTQGS